MLHEKERWAAQGQSCSLMEPRECHLWVHQDAIARWKKERKKKGGGDARCNRNGRGKRLDAGEEGASIEKGKAKERGRQGRNVPVDTDFDRHVDDGVVWGERVLGMKKRREERKGRRKKPVISGTRRKKQDGCDCLGIVPCLVSRPLFSHSLTHSGSQRHPICWPLHDL